MGFVPSLVFLVSGFVLVGWTYLDEARGSATGWNNPYLGVRPRGCSPEAFRARIRQSILKSLLWRLLLTGLAALAVCAGCIALLPEGLDALGGAADLSAPEVLCLWATASMVAMVDRAYGAMSARF